MDRVFLDANILISSVWRPDAGLRRSWTLPEVVLITSTWTIEEALRNLHQQDRRDRFDQLLADVQVVNEWDHITLSDDIVLPEKDMPILQGEIAAQATHLITGDVRDFAQYFGRTIAGVEILRPAVYLALKGAIYRESRTLRQGFHAGSKHALHANGSPRILCPATRLGDCFTV